jgi:tetratricopeptide (TPR) repeat protein
MAADRLEALRSMLISDPNNTFARYGLAMELVKMGDLDAAINEFAVLRERNPDYAAAYFHGGKALEALGRLDEAREVMEEGIRVTTRTGDAHTRSELQAALDLLGL